MSTPIPNINPMRIIEFTPDHAEPITQFESHLASALPLGHGHGEAHIYCVYFGPGGIIGEHPAGYCQLFLIIAGSGWAADADGKRIPLHTGQGAYFERGETHSKGSETGMTVLMVQVTDLQPTDET